MNGRSGTTAVELMLTLVLWGIVSTAVVGTLLRTARAVRRVAIRVDRRDMLRAATSLSAFELRGTAGGPATLRVASDEIQYRARRWASVTCGWARPNAGTIGLTLRALPTLGERPPIAQRDSAVVWLEGYPADPNDGQWHAAAVTAVDTGTCHDGAAAVVIALESWQATIPTLRVQPGSPVVGYERAALRIYRAADGDYWLGHATADAAGWNVVQPVAGPFASTSGFALRADGRSIAIGLRSAGSESDSVEVIVAVRADGDGAP